MCASESVKPIFVISLPRSGSTLLQRLLASHGSIATASEPWLLIPNLYAFREAGVCADYGHQLLNIATEDFCQILPNGKADYLQSVAAFANNLYTTVAQAQGGVYFLDKTPRYVFFVKELFAMFPDAKFIFLWRNPLSIIASIAETWARGGWNLYGNHVDLFRGMESMIDAYSEFKTHVFSVTYEQLVEQTETVVSKIYNFLEVEPDGAESKSFEGVALAGRLGDPTAGKKYAVPSVASMEGWRSTINTPLRKRWAIKYLDFISHSGGIEGYDIETLKDQVLSVRSDKGKTLLDVVEMPCFLVQRFFDYWYVKNKYTDYRKYNCHFKYH